MHYIIDFITKIIRQFMAPLYKDDLMPVIRQGIFMSIIGGLLIGSLDFFIEKIFSMSLIWMMLFVFGILLAKRIRGAYRDYHILYAIISVFVIFLTFYFAYLVFYAGYYYINSEQWSGTITFWNYFKNFLNPLQYFQFLNFFSSSFYRVNNLLNVLFFLIVNIYVVRYIR